MGTVDHIGGGAVIVIVVVHCCWIVVGQTIQLVTNRETKFVSLLTGPYTTVHWRQLMFTTFPIVDVVWRVGRTLS